MERENLHGDAKGKGTSGSNREAERTDAPARDGLLRSSDEAGVMPVERRERVIAIDQVNCGRVTGRRKSLMINGRRQSSCDGTSRMNREVHVRFCERLGVQFPGPTRQTRSFGERQLNVRFAGKRTRLKRFTSTRPNKRDRSSLAVGRSPASPAIRRV